MTLLDSWEEFEKAAERLYLKDYLQQYSNMIMSKLTRETVVLYSKTPGTWLWDDYKSACDLILTLNK